MISSLMDKLFQKKVWLPLAIIVFIVQLAIPAYMIFEQKQTLSKGDLHKFKVEPIDPYDPFRGRYVVLSFAAGRNPVPLIDFEQLEGEELARDSWVYAHLTTDKEGFAEIKQISLAKPKSNFLKVKASYSHYGSENKYRVQIPFDRYYAPENKAYAIETNVRDRSRRSSEDDVYVAVKIYKGKGTIEDLYINGLSILKFVEQEQSKN